MGKGCWLESGGAELEVVENITEFMAYCCAAGGNKEGTVVGSWLQ